MDEDAPEGLEDALKALMAEDGPTVIVSWVVMVEYVDHNGDANLNAWSSETPPWRLSGIMSECGSMLLSEYEDDTE